MIYKSKQLAEALLALTEKNPDKEKEIISNFLEFCRKKNLLIQLPNIAKHLELMAKAKANAKQLSIFTSHEISNSIIEKIKKLAQVPDNVPMNIQQNKNIKGGFIAKYKGMIYDGSIRTQLEKLKNSLANNL